MIVCSQFPCFQWHLRYYFVANNDRKRKKIGKEMLWNVVKWSKVPKKVHFSLIHFTLQLSITAYLPETIEPNTNSRLIYCYIPTTVAKWWISVTHKASSSNTGEKSFFKNVADRFFLAHSLNLLVFVFFSFVFSLSRTAFV